MNRRGFISGLLSSLGAPAIVRSGILMPIRKIDVLRGFDYGFVCYDVRTGRWLPFSALERLGADFEITGIDRSPK